MPHSAARASWCARNGTPAVGSSGLGADRVSGRNRVPLPPTSMIASRVSRGICILTFERLMSWTVAVVQQATHAAYSTSSGTRVGRLLVGGALVAGHVSGRRSRPGELLGSDVAC